MLLAFIRMLLSWDKLCQVGAQQVVLRDVGLHDVSIVILVCNVSLYIYISICTYIYIHIYIYMFNYYGEDPLGSSSFYPTSVGGGNKESRAVPTQKKNWPPNQQINSKTEKN